MKVSNINIALTGQDILSIINDFISVEGVTISEIDINEEVSIKGNFKKGFSIDFEAKLVINSIGEGRIQCDLTGFKVINIGVFSFIRKIALKYALKSLSDKGIQYIDGKVDIQYKYLLKDVPYIDFDITSITLLAKKLNVEIVNAEISLDGALKKEIKLFKPVESTEEEKGTEERGKVEDLYTVGRIQVENKLPQKVKKYSDYIFVIPDIAALIYRLLKDDRVSTKTKLIISASVAYIAVPTDIIPDKIPFVGKIDELAVAFFALNRIVKDVPMHIILENWQGKNDIILVVKNIIEYITNFTGAQNVETLYEFVDEVLSI